MSKGICICLWTQSTTLHLASVERDGLFEVRFGLGGSSQLGDLVFGLWAIQPICIKFTMRAAILAKHNASKPRLPYWNVR